MKGKLDIALLMAMPGLEEFRMSSSRTSNSGFKPKELITAEQISEEEPLRLVKGQAGTQLLRSPSLRRALEIAKPMLIAGKSLIEIHEVIPNADWIVWCEHDSWCSSFDLDPFGCNNWKSFIPREKFDSLETYRGALQIHEQCKRVMELFSMGVIEIDSIRSLMGLSDRLIVSIKPRPNWPDFLLVAEWELPDALIRYPLFVTGRRKLYTRWLELNPETEPPFFLSDDDKGLIATPITQVAIRSTKPASASKRFEERKRKTEAMYERWRKEYKRQKRARPGMSDVWYSMRVAKTFAADGRDSETIRKHMKPKK